MGNKKNLNRKSKKKANNWRGIIKMRKSKSKSHRQSAECHTEDSGTKCATQLDSLTVSQIDDEIKNMSEVQPIYANSSIVLLTQISGDDQISGEYLSENDISSDNANDKCDELELEDDVGIGLSTTMSEDQPNSSTSRSAIDRVNDESTKTIDQSKCLEAPNISKNIVIMSEDQPNSSKKRNNDAETSSLVSVIDYDELTDVELDMDDETSSLISIIEYDQWRDFEEDMSDNGGTENGSTSNEPHQSEEVFNTMVEHFEEPQSETGNPVIKNNNATQPKRDTQGLFKNNYGGSNGNGGLFPCGQTRQDGFQLSGRRIVDINPLFKQFKSLSWHSDTCHIEDMECMNETRNGLSSIFEFQCTTCGYKQSILSSDKTDPVDVNNAAILGITSVGLGSYHLNEFCANMNIPPMSDYMYARRDKIQQIDWWKLAKTESFAALNEEIRLAKLNGDVDSAGNALIVVVCDGSWPKRSYNTNFTSLSGCAVIIGVRTNKVIYFDVKNKYCHVCKIAQSRNEEPREGHECNKNYVGPASSMETLIVVEGFQACEKLGLRFKEYVADGDSSTYKTICDSKIYQNPDMEVEKDECCNHLYRNYRKAFEALGKATKKFKPDARKYITKRKGHEVCLGVQTAAKHWRSSSLTVLEKLVNLEKDVLNAPMHCFGIHDDCDKYFCSKTTEPEARQNVDLLKSDGIFYEILNLCQTYFASSVPSLLLNYNNNAAESFNNLIAKYTGGKRINYCLAGIYQARVARAVVQYNTGGCSGSTYHKFKDSFATESLKALEQCRKRKLKKNDVAKAAKPKKSRYSVQVEDKGEQYGPNRQTNDMTPHVFEIAKTTFLEKLLEDQSNRDFINRSTIGQHLVQKWRDMHRTLLTSWYFSRIINARGPQSYANIVEDVIYKKTKFSKTAEIRHQGIYEKKALRCFTDIHGSNYISECGLFIDMEHCFLAATPFRLFGDNGIVFVKCPVLAFKLKIQEAIEKKLIPYWKQVKGVETVNKSSAWYIELQAELHIAEKSFAFLVVWVESDIRIETVYRDDDFWLDTMEKPLVSFYEEAMIKELVNPRKARSMQVRAYNTETKTFE